MAGDIAGRCVPSRGAPIRRVMSLVHRRSTVRLAIPLRLLMALGMASLALCAQASAANYYGVAYLYGNQFNGTAMNIRSNSLSVPDINTQAIANNNWIVNTAYSPNVFIEAGIAVGNISHENCNQVLLSPTFFWADKRPNSNYYCHVDGAASMNTYYTDQIWYSGTQWNWYIKVGPYSGTSTSSIPAPNYIETGTEEAGTNQGTACASQGGGGQYLGYWDANMKFHTGWSDASNGNALIHQDKPPYAYWVSTTYWLRDYANTSC